jgi:hypothetical protein
LSADSSSLTSPIGSFSQVKKRKTHSPFLSGRHIIMKYSYEVQSDRTKTVHAFAEESSQVEWIAACLPACLPVRPRRVEP